MQSAEDEEVDEEEVKKREEEWLKDLAEEKNESRNKS